MCSVFHMDVSFQLPWVNPRSVIARSYGKNMFSLVRNCQTVFQSSHTIFAFPSATNESSYCSATSSAFGIVSILAFGFCNKCVVVSHCFNLYFLNDIWCRVSFHMLICHLYTLFDGVSVKSFGPFFSQMLLTKFSQIKHTG